MFERFHTYMTADHLDRQQHQVWRRLNDRERRAKILIGVIDDAEFAPKQNLENLGYRIQFLGDPVSVEAVKDCHIVLCDLQGVGRALDPQKQGAFFIKEIRANYPEKYVIAYTGGGMNQNISREALIAADAFLKKDATIEEWRDKLDPFVKKLLDPSVVWQRQREALINNKIDTMSILKLEDAFVHSITKNEPAEHSAFQRKSAELSVGGRDVRAIVQSMIASGLYALLIGG